MRNADPRCEIGVARVPKVLPAGSDGEIGGVVEILYRQWTVVVLFRRRRIELPADAVGEGRVAANSPRILREDREVREARILVAAKCLNHASETGGLPRHDALDAIEEDALLVVLRVVAGSHLPVV